MLSLLIRFFVGGSEDRLICFCVHQLLQLCRIFDGDAVAGTLVRTLAAQKGVDPDTLGTVSGEAHKQQQYDLLAETVRRHMDMQTIYRILEEGV